MSAFISLVNADVIILKDGSYLEVYNVQVAPKWIFYTVSADENSEIKKIQIDNVFGYKIGDGPLTSTEESSANSQDQSNVSSESLKPSKLEPKPASDNALLIAAYNNHPPLQHLKKKPEPDKYTNHFLSLWGIEEGSILSDENVEVGFENYYVDGMYGGHSYHGIGGTRIKVINKTDHPIYVDLASCYKIMNDGYSMSYFNNSIYKKGVTNTTGASMNMGAVAGALGVGGVLGKLASGLNVGGAAGSSTEIITAEQRILTIPPRSRVILPCEKNSYKDRIDECFEPFYFNNVKWDEIEEDFAVRSGDSEPDLLTIVLDKRSQKIGDNENCTNKDLNIKKWIQTDFSPENSPKKIGRIITYSTSPDFSTFISLPINIYMRGAFGITPPSYTGTRNTKAGDARFIDKNYDCIVDKEHFLVGRGYVKSK